VNPHSSLIIILTILPARNKKREDIVEIDLLINSSCTCAGYDDDAKIFCEHGGEGGQNVSLSMLLFFS